MNKIFTGGGCSAPVGVSTKLKPLDVNFQLTITGGVWSLDGLTKVEHTLEQTFAQIKQTNKHKLSPTDEGSNKKLKVGDEDDENNIQPDNKVDEVDKSVEKIDNSDLKIGDLDKKSRIFCGLTENPNVPIDVIIKCDNLGRDLANELINKGALDVMKVTQDLIRSSVVKSS